MDELNSAGNILNIVVLDACRNNPFSWARSGSRGLSVVANPPADSIIVYATSAGSVAEDGEGRNGLFTSYLLPNLGTPDLEVKEIFNRTGAAVSQASDNRQRPAVYTQFFGSAYLAERIYRIGDTGPAGGLIFYDKGVFSDGWRYLEAAPAETEVTAAQWGMHGQEVPGTRTVVGSGKRNTYLIVERLRQSGENESGRAAQLCASLNHGGFADWFLPSKDELDLIYKNLKQKGLGGFGNNWYWSSSHLINFDGAWGQNFGGGSQGDGGKSSSGSVRTVRAF
jgi:hypothetical protein